MKEKKVTQSKQKKPCCKKNKCKAKPDNGKGDSPRNNHSSDFRDNFENINWSKK